MVKHLVAAQNDFFATQKTKEVAYRKKYLKKLPKIILQDRQTNPQSTPALQNL